MRQWLGMLPPVVFPMVLAAQQRTDTVTLAPVVVTATRLPTRADALPTSVTVISGARLRAEGIRTVAEALRIVPGAAVVTTGPWGGQASLFLAGGKRATGRGSLTADRRTLPGGATTSRTLPPKTSSGTRACAAPRAWLNGPAP